MKTEPTQSEIRLAGERGKNAGLSDARNYDADPESFEASSNPYGMDSEPCLHEAWADGYEDTFEGTKGRP